MTLSAAALLAIVAHLHVPRSQVDPDVVLAIGIHESRLESHVCRDEDDGSSSRGVMQINRKDSRCTPEDDARYADDYDPETNIRHAVRLLVIERAYHLTHCRHPHDVLEHYAGTGRDARRFALEVRRIVKRLKEERKAKKKWHS